MKQMRSRFRLITLLLVCAFLLTLALCGGTVLRTAGVSLSSLSSLPFIAHTPAPDASVSPETSSSPESPVSPAPSDSPQTIPAGTPGPGADNSPNPEYNVFGL